MSSYHIPSDNIETNAKNSKDTKTEKGGNLNINLTLLSNKSSIETLMTMAKKQKNGKTKKETQNSNEDNSIPSMYSSIKFDQSKRRLINNQSTLINSCSDSNGLRFIRGDKKLQIGYTTKINGQLNIIRKLNSNLESKSTTNLLNNKTQPVQEIKSMSETQPLPENCKEETKTHLLGRANGKAQPLAENCKEETKAHLLSRPNGETQPLAENCKEETKTHLLGRPNDVKSLFSRDSFLNEPKEAIYKKANYSIKKANSVLEFSYREEQNPSYKEEMEDMGKAVDNFNNNKNEGLFCLFDGHGGDAVSKYLQEHFPSCFKQALYDSNGDVQNALVSAFNNIDKELEGLELANVGSTGCVIYVLRENNQLIVYTANIGDTRCSLISPEKYIQLTYDHRADVPEETERIIDSGGEIISNRVMGVLMLTRAFGDFELKPYGVKSEPYISRTIIDSTQNNQVLVCASDGVWDVVNEEDIQNYISFNNEAETETEDLCKTIVKYSIAKGSWDNISCFAIKLT